MSDKNKLLYYFEKSSISSHKDNLIDTPIVTVRNQDTNTIDTATLIETNESNSTSSSSTSLFQSSTSSSEFEIRGNENLKNKENASTTTTTTSSFKRGSEQAREFILLGPYKPATTLPTVNHRHFCLNGYKVYKWIESSETKKKRIVLFVDLHIRRDSVMMHLRRMVYQVLTISIKVSS